MEVGVAIQTSYKSVEEKLWEEETAEAKERRQSSKASSSSDEDEHDAKKRSCSSSSTSSPLFHLAMVIVRTRSIKMACWLFDNAYGQNNDVRLNSLIYDCEDERDFWGFLSFYIALHSLSPSERLPLHHSIWIFREFLLRTKCRYYY